MLSPALRYSLLTLLAIVKIPEKSLLLVCVWAVYKDVGDLPTVYSAIQTKVYSKKGHLRTTTLSTFV